jgi:hypothetical protein
MNYYSLHPEAVRQASATGMDFEDVLEAANDPVSTLDDPSPWVIHQQLRAREGIVTVCDTVAKTILSVYRDNHSSWANTEVAA